MLFMFWDIDSPLKFMKLDPPLTGSAFCKNSKTSQGSAHTRGEVPATSPETAPHTPSLSFELPIFFTKSSRSDQILVPCYKSHEI